MVRAYQEYEILPHVRFVPVFGFFSARTAAITHGSRPRKLIASAAIRDTRGLEKDPSADANMKLIAPFGYRITCPYDERPIHESSD